MLNFISGDPNVFYTGIGNSLFQGIFFNEDGSFMFLGKNYPSVYDVSIKKEQVKLTEVKEDFFLLHITDEIQLRSNQKNALENIQKDIFQAIKQPSLLK